MLAKTKVKLVCAVCALDYFVQPYRARTSKCCSKQCSQSYAASFAGAIQMARRGSGVKHRYVKELGRHQHRVIAEKELGRPLERGEIVYHIDGNGKNNHPSNLQVMTQSEHIKIHLADMREASKRKVPSS